MTESDNGMIFRPLPEVQEQCQCWLMDTVPIVVAALNVLLVEDSPILTQLLAEVLRQIPAVHLVDTVETEAAALAVVKREIVDVIVLDLHLKQGSGFGILRKLASASQTPRVIVLTNYDLPEYRAKAMALGATHFMDKARDYGSLPKVLHHMKIDRDSMKDCHP